MISAVLAADCVANCSNSGWRVVNAFSIEGGIGEYFVGGGTFIGWVDCCPKAAPVMPMAM